MICVLVMWWGFQVERPSAWTNHTDIHSYEWFYSALLVSVIWIDVVVGGIVHVRWDGLCLEVVVDNLFFSLALKLLNLSLSVYPCISLTFKRTYPTIF